MTIPIQNCKMYIAKINCWHCTHTLVRLCCLPPPTPVSRWMRQAIREGSVHLFWKRRVLGGVSSPRRHDIRNLEILFCYWSCERPELTPGCTCALNSDDKWNQTLSRTHCGSHSAWQVSVSACHPRRQF